MFAPDDADQTGALRVASDFADDKPYTDLLLQGSVYPANGEAVTACRAAFAVGGWQKMLLAVGERVALHGGGASDPKPFTEMPITWENAFGGPGLAANPAGRGWGGTKPGELLPMIGPATNPPRPPEQAGRPACFAPVSPYWATRRDRMGRNYGSAYKATRAPFFSDDFDWRYFNAAPADQQLEDRLKGDEWLRFVCLSPRSADLRTQLPKQHVRVVMRRQDGSTHEIPMRLDTLLAKPAAGTITLTWRGHASVTEEDFGDIAALLVAAEAADAPQVALDTYRAALHHAVNPRKRRRPAPPSSPGSRPQGSNGLDPTTAHVAARLDGHAPGALGPLQARMTSAIALTETRGIDLRGKLGEAAARIEASSPQSGTANSTRRNPIPRSSLIALRNAVSKVKSIRAEHGAAMPSHGAAELDAALSNPAMLKLLAGGATPPPDDFTGDMRGRDLRGRDLSDRDLSGFDLTGCRLSGSTLRGASLAGTVLEEADLTGVDLTDALMSGARLGRAILHRAFLKATLLADADLTGADLSEARLIRCILTGAKLAAATLVSTRVWKSDLSGADLAGADLGRAIVMNSDLSGGRLDSIRAIGSTWRRCTLHAVSAADAVFNGSIWRSCGARGLVAPRAHFARCRLSRSGFSGANLAGASFFESEGEGVNWSGSTLDGADFRRTRLVRALFIEAAAERADFAEADLTGARFRKARLHGTSFQHAKLLGADFDQTELHNVVFDEALLFKTRFYKVRTAGATFAGADLTRAIVVQR